MPSVRALDCWMGACEERLEHKAQRAADRARSLCKKRVIFERTQLRVQQQQRSASAAPAGRGCSQWHGAARVVTRTCLSKGLVQTSSDMPALSSRGVTHGKKITVAGVINYQGKEKYTTCDESDDVNVSFFPVSKNPLEAEESLASDASTTEGSEPDVASDRCDSLQTTPASTPPMQPTIPDMEATESLPPLPAQADESSSSGNEGLSNDEPSSSPQEASPTHVQSEQGGHSNSKSRKQAKAEVKEALELARKQALQFRKQRSQEAQLKAMAEKADRTLRKAKDLQEEAEAEAMAIKAKCLAEASVAAEEQAEARRRAVEAEAQVFFDESMEKLAQAETSMRAQLQEEAEAAKAKALSEAEAQKEQIEADLKRMKRRAETEAIVIKSRAQIEAKEIMEQAEAARRSRQEAEEAAKVAAEEQARAEAEAQQAAEKEKQKEAKALAREAANAALKHAKDVAQQKAKMYRRMQNKERLEAQKRAAEMDALRAQAEAEGRAAWAKALSEAEAIKAKAAADAQKLQERLREQAMMFEAESRQKALELKAESATAQGQSQSELREAVLEEASEVKETADVAEACNGEGWEVLGCAVCETSAEPEKEDEEEEEEEEEEGEEEEEKEEEEEWQVIG